LEYFGFTYLYGFTETNYMYILSKNK
jgi:hypothetical protein